MKKIALSSLLFINAIISLHAQIYTPSGTILGNSTNTNVGIGVVANPSEKLEINGNLKFTNNGSKVFLGFNDYIQFTDGNGDGFKFIYDDLERVRITNGGNVGIGTSSPSQKLDVNGNINMAGVAGRRLFMGGSSGSTFGIAYDSNYPNYGIFYTEGEPDYVSISPNGNATAGIMNVLGNGKVGIGTSTPSEVLEVYSSDTTPGTISLKSSRNDFGYVDVGRISAKQASVEVSRIGMPRAAGTNTGFLTFWTKADNSTDLTEKMRISENGNVGIGTSNPSNDQGWNKVLDVAGSGHAKVLVTADNSNFKTGVFSHSSWNGGGGFVGTESNHTLFLVAGYDPKVSILTNGNVGIGTKTPDTKLTVNGNIHAKEVKIDLSIPVPDYVFASDYKLKSLLEVEAYIKQNNHLPEIPSAQEIEKNGLMLAEMNMVLLKKMEEMTLYVIEQNRISQELIKKVEILEAALKK
jgi:hypothetical protein